MPYRERVPEFQAIIMAGYGNGLYPLTEENNMPKALLPIVNQPMISYQLSWLESSGVHDVIVVSLKSGSDKLGHYLKKVYEGPLRISIEIVDDNTGTADALASIKDKIKTDFLVISCDLMTDLIPHQFLDMHRSEDPTVTALFFEPSKGEGGPSGSSKVKDVTQYIGVDASNSQLVYLNNADSMAEDEFSLRISLLNKHPVMNISRLLQDGHLYVFKRWVVDLISVVSQKRTMASLKEHVLPLLVKSQYQKVLADREGVTKAVKASMAAHPNTQKLALSLSTTQPIATEEEGNGEDSDEDEQTGEWKSPVHCKAFVLPKEIYCGRANTIPNYFEVNRYYTKTTDKVRNPGASSQVQTQVGADSLIGDDTKLGERSSVKKSTLGSHITIGKNVKIVNSIIMDHAILEDNVKVEGCIICAGSKICEKSTLKDCEVGGGFRVEKETTARNEQLVDFQEQ
ncbi:translation initiation factor eIF-2B subunit gamma [Entomortierella parvispora]|uniref:Translation initiation factor eIF2B subunit gamma n=1 Tax=Entomortierella parvispora TaxID=205924 RepID=A0A9P3HK50_9FUNG|nr:translation initiation factor eIF-2B subunit gamma [Entomortierella parvispora]